MINKDLLNINKTYVLAVSGGVDSMVLLDILHQAQFKFIVCHINHNTRGQENILEEKLVSETCMSKDVEFFKFNFNYEAGSGNFHQVARDFRLACYNKLSQKYNCDGVILAHHRDDVVENIVMNKEQITSRIIKDVVIINGLKIIRPLLGVYKCFIYDYSNQHDICYMEDSSNNLNKYKRNKFRNLKLNKLDVNQKEDIIHLESRRIEEIESYDKFNFENNSVNQKKYFLIILLNSFAIYNISDNFLMQVINSYTKNGTKIHHVNDKFNLVVAYGKIIVEKRVEISNLSPKRVKKGYNNYNGIKFICESDHYFVRSRAIGDRVQYANFSKKISRIMIDEKIPKYLRDSWPVLVDEFDNVISIVNKENVIMDHNEVLKEILVTEEQIIEICETMGAEITLDYKNTEQPVIFLGLLKGCHPFMSDLLKCINLKLEIDYMDVSSFFGGTVAQDEVQIVKDMTASVKNRDVVIIEDIVDSGRTIKKIQDLLEFRGAKSVEVATLIDKPSGRTVELVPKYIGTEVPKAFIIGYGLDYKEYYRNLKCIGVPKDELIKE